MSDGEIPWEHHADLDCVECPDCAFCFQDVHRDEDGGYSCPECLEASLRDEIASWKRLVEMKDDALERIADPHNDRAPVDLKDAIRIAQGARDGTQWPGAFTEDLRLRVATLETALRYALDCIESPDIQYAPGKDIYDTHMMRGAMVRARAALAGSEEAISPKISRVYNCGAGKRFDCAIHGPSDNPAIVCPTCLSNAMGDTIATPDERSSSSAG